MKADAELMRICAMRLKRMLELNDPPVVVEFMARTYISGLHSSVWAAIWAWFAWEVRRASTRHYDGARIWFLVHVCRRTHERACDIIFGEDEPEGTGPGTPAQ